MEILLSFVAGLVVAAVVAVLVVKNIIKSRVRQAEQTVALRLESEYKAESVRLMSELKHMEERIKQQQGAIDATKADAQQQLQAAKEEAQKQLQATKDEAQQQLTATKTEAANGLEAAKAEWAQRHKEDLEARDQAHKDAMDSLQKRFDETMAKVTAQVKEETNEMLKARQKEFSETSNVSLGQIVNPLKENIAELKKAMEEGNKEQAERNGEMRERIKNLMEHSDAARKSADELAAAFKHGNKIQGDWGETILEELLASHGLTKGVHFDTQVVIKGKDGKTVKNEEGNMMKPDVILHLDERREVIIDSKVSLTSYVDYVNAENEADRQTYLKAHVESVKKHVKELAAKDYSAYIQSPKVSAGYVLMFVPNIGALWTALKAEPDLWRKAAESNVYITDEQSLYGALKIVSLTWTQVAQTQNHELVYKLANEMIERVGMFMERYDAIGGALEDALKEFNEGKKKLLPNGQSIVNTSNKLLRLGAKNSDRHPIPTLLDVDQIQQIEG